MENKYVTVTALTKYIKQKIDYDPHLQEVLLRGEISNFNHHRSGHMYLTLKDEGATIPAVMFRGHNRHLTFTPEDGMDVLVKGYVSVFERFGHYQFYIESMDPAGIGALYLAYEQLKERLQKAGYFDEEHKKKIPAFPEHIAVITSPTGAAVRDIVTTIRRRYPIVQVTVIPAQVQGEGASESIVEAIRQAHVTQQVEFDTIILARGGGSIEDLWCFNEEKVIEAVFQSRIPIISGVGHETDVTLTDYVADLRAATPTAAAELAVPSLVEIERTLAHVQARVIKLADYVVKRRHERLTHATKTLLYHNPHRLVMEKEQVIDYMTDKLRDRMHYLLEEKRMKVESLHSKLQQRSPQHRLQELTQRIEVLNVRQRERIKFLIEQKERNVQAAIEKLVILNPLHVMRRGFAVLYDETDELVTSVNDVKVEEKINIKVQDGTLNCEIKEIWRDSK